MKVPPKRRGQARPQQQGIGSPAGPAPVVPHDAAPPVGWARPETLAALGILALALALRLFELGARPLQASEAAHAWDSWTLARGTGGSASAGPLLIYGHALAFFLFGASDATARLLPALAGTALVGLPLLLERELGRVGSRAAMLLLAISPTLVYYSRLADPSILAAGAALGLVASGGVAWRDGDRRALYAAAACAALLLTAGPPGYHAIAVLAIALLMSARPAKGAERAGRFGRAIWSRVGLVGGAVWLLATTGLLTSLHGVQEGLVDGLTGWLAYFATPGPEPALVYAAVLGAYELPALAFGLLGAAAARKGSPLAGYLGWWALGAFVLASVTATRPLGLAPLVVVPLALLAGHSIGRVVADLGEREFRVDLGRVALVGGVLLAGLAIALNHLTTPEPVVPDVVLALPVLLLGGALALAVQTYGTRRALRLLRALALGALLLFAWRATVLLGFRSPANPAELFVGTATSADVRALAADAAEALDALAYARPGRGVVVAPSLEHPLRWYLRGEPDVVVGDGAGGAPGVAILPADSQRPPGSSLGQRYQVATAARPLGLGSWREAWRWLAFREPPRPAAPVEAIVYVAGAPTR